MRLPRLLTRPASHRRRTAQAWAEMELALDERTVQLNKADKLIAKLVRQRDEQRARADGLQVENDALRDAYDELFARRLGITTISVPAPMDNLPAIRPATRDSSETQDMVVTTLWNAHGLRPLQPKNAA